MILLGTDEQVRLAAHAATEMVAGRKVDLAKLVVSLRNFIRQALDLAPIPPELLIPNQGPLRPMTSAGRGSGGGAGGGANRAGGGGSGNKGGGMDGGMGAGTVSYTHLDVYKRQASYSARGKITETRSPG